MRIEHVGPDPHIHLGVDLAQYLELLRQALAQQLRHSSAAAGLAGPAFPDLIHAENIPRRRDGGMHAASHVAPDLVDLWFAHADGGLAIVDRKAVIVADAQAVAVPDASAREEADGGPFVVK